MYAKWKLRLALQTIKAIQVMYIAILHKRLKRGNISGSYAVEVRKVLKYKNNLCFN